MIDFKKFIQFIKNKIRGAPADPAEKQLSNHTNISEKQLSDSTNINSKNQNIMTTFNYGVGGSEVKPDANEAIQQIQENKTLLVGKMTVEDPIAPEVVKGLKTVEDVFKHYKPAISVDHQTAEGETVSEEFTFRNPGDFTPKNLVKNSAFLKNMSLQEEQYNNMIRQLRNNKILNNMLSNGQAKAEFIEVLKAIAAELENNDTK